MRTDDQITDEYEMVCAEMARKGRTGKPGDLLPCLISTEILDAIHNDLYAFQKRVREHAYALAMEKMILPTDGQ